MSTKPRFEKAAKGNSEMDYYTELRRRRQVIYRTI